ncbi:MAG: NlpC/P60 family protein [Propionibacteriaceae bacterium]
MKRAARAIVALMVTVAVALGLVVGGASAASAVVAKKDTPVAAKTRVNIRSGPGTSYRIIGGLDRGQRVSALGQRSGSWVKVSFDGSAGYILGKYVNATGRKLPATPTKISTSGTKITTATLRVRTSPKLTAKVVGSLAEGTKVTLTGKQSKGFAQLRYGSKLRWASVTYLARYSSGSAAAPAPVVGNKGVRALAYARAQLGKPYKWGAVGPSSFDCSGLVLQAWRSVGVSLPRTSRQQSKAGTWVSKSALKPGDLVFFFHPVSHVGMYVGNGMIINAPRPGKNVEYTKLSSNPYNTARRPG